MNKNRFFNFVSNGKDSDDLYLYGSIISGDKWDETDVNFQDFKQSIEELNDNSTLNIYQNSPGGECFACSSIVALLQRAKDRGITINAYIDGLSASCSSWISCCADNLYIYNHSIMMLHKPMSMAWGNADEMQKEIEILDKIQNDVMLPIYMSKAKDNVTEEQIQELVNKETWLNAEEIQEYFNCTLIEEEKKIACCVDKDLFNKYKNVPSNLMDLANKEVKNMEEENVKIIENNNSDIENQEGKEANIEELNNKIEELTEQLNSSNTKIVELNETITNLQSIVDEYNELKEKKAKEEKENKLNEKVNYFKEKFDKAKSIDVFNSEEVQELLKDCVDNIESNNKINEILIDIYDNLDLSKNNQHIEQPSNMDNLLDIEDGVEKYGFK